MKFLTIIGSIFVATSLAFKAGDRLRSEDMVSIADDALPLTSYMNKLFTLLLPTITKSLAGLLPASYGNCNAGAPTPCICNGNCDNLYYVHKSWEYEAYARWITGLNSLQLSGITFLPEANNKIGLSITGVFPSLPASIYIGECFTFDKCSILWDNTNGCCGNNVHFEIKLNFDCDASNIDSHLSNIQVEVINMDKIELTESIGVIHIPVQDLTNSFTNVIRGLLSQAITKGPFIPWPPQAGSPNYDIQGLLNFFAKSTTKGGAITCS